MKIEWLEWDSDFFDLSIGKIQISYLDEFDLNVFKEKAKSYDLVYLISDYKINNLTLVDEKEVFVKKNIDNVNFTFENTLSFSSKKHSYKQLLNLALQSGKYSRFNLDENFPSNVYDKLYTEWIDKSISKELAIDVFIKIINNKIVGFITLTKITDGLAGIGLVAVDSKYRGYGIAKELTNKAMHEAKILGFKSIQVVTQHNNTPAVNFYKSIGFKSESITNIYHYWNQSLI